MLQQCAILIQYWTDENRGPQFSPILAAVVNFRVGIRASFKGGAHLRCYVGIALPSQQGAKTLPKYLGSIETGQRKETVIRKHNWIIGLLRVGKCHRHPGSFGCDHKRPQIFSMALN